MRVGSTGFAAGINALVPIPLADVRGADQTLGGTACVTHACRQKGLHVVSFCGIEHGVHVAVVLIDYFSVGIYDLFDRVGGIVFTAVGHTGIGTDKFGEVHVAGTERERRGFAQLGFDAHILRCSDHIVDAYFLSELNGDGVHALCECTSQGKFGAGEASVGIVGGPDRGLAVFVCHIHANV